MQYGKVRTGYLLIYIRIKKCALMVQYSKKNKNDGFHALRPSQAVSRHA